MRLIDGDALVAWIKESQHQTTKMKNVICRIESMPSVPSADARREAFKEGFNEGMLYERRFPKRPQGQWIFRREFVEDTPFTGYRCSNCNYWQGMGAWNFCPHCGCRMKGADDEFHR